MNIKATRIDQKKASKDLLRRTHALIRSRACLTVMSFYAALFIGLCLYGFKNDRSTLDLAAVMTSSPTIPENVTRRTDAGVDLSDPMLYGTIDLLGNSTTATVMGMAAGYGLDVYKMFVGSLRRAGFQGHIILGVAPNVQPNILEYFDSRNVTPQILTHVPCTYPKIEGEHKDSEHCPHPYSDIKSRWGRVPLQRDWLLDCKKCTGPVLSIDVRDTFFQKDPFGPGSPPITGLQVFQEHPNQTTSHWLVDVPVKQCKGMKLREPMLCSGSVIGTRAAMIKYFEVMYAEMKVWMNRTKCRTGLVGDDQSVHNYLFYTGQLPFATAIPNRVGIVNTPGVEGSILYENWRKTSISQGLSQDAAIRRPFPGATSRSWIGTSYNLTDEDGFLTQYDGTRSRVVHQADRFGYYFWYMWLTKQQWASD